MRTTDHHQGRSIFAMEFLCEGYVEDPHAAFPNTTTSDGSSNAFGFLAVGEK